MGFTKLDSGIIHSSVWGESADIRIVWITMLAMCDSDGFVATSVPGLQRAANVSKEQFDNAIKILESPDKYSRTTANEGRRIEKCEGGWIILNYKLYRDRDRENNRREYMRDLMRTKRSPVSNNANNLLTHAKSSASASVSSSVSCINSIKDLNINSKDIIHAEKNKSTRFEKPTIDMIKAYCLERKNSVDADRFFNHYESNGWKVGKNPMKSWQAAVRTWEHNSFQQSSSELSDSPRPRPSMAAYNKAAGRE
jgi:hypothetical protein